MTKQLAKRHNSPPPSKFKLVSLSHTVEPQMGSWEKKVRIVPVWEAKLSSTICCWHHPSLEKKKKQAAETESEGDLGCIRRGDNSSPTEIAVFLSKTAYSYVEYLVYCCAVLGL